MGPRQRRRGDDRLRRSVIPGRVVQRPEESLATRGSDPRVTPGAFLWMGVVRADRPGPNAAHEANCATGEGTDGRCPASRLSGDKRTSARFDLRMPLGGQGPTPFSPGPALLVGKEADPCPLAMMFFLLLRPVSSREVAAQREWWDVAGPGATIAPALAHATDPAVQQRCAASVGHDLCPCASRKPALHDHSAAEAPEAVPPLLSSRYEESFPCGNS
jgi:hypothetical protein